MQIEGVRTSLYTILIAGSWILNAFIKILYLARGVYSTKQDTHVPVGYICIHQKGR